MTLGIASAFIGCRLTFRCASWRAALGLAVSYLSNLEAGRLSPSLAMLRKVLVALGTDLEPFFANSPAIPKGHVFRLQQMRRVADGSRSYTFILPPRPDIRLIMFDEVLFAGEDPQYESLTGDLAGYILTGELILEVQGEPRRRSGPGMLSMCQPGDRCAAGVVAMRTRFAW